MTRILKSTLGTLRQNRHGPTHSAIVKGQVKEQYVSAVQHDPEKALRQIGVTVRQLTLTGSPSQHIYFPESMFRQFQATINWKQGFPDAVRHDATVMALVCRLREGSRATDIFENRFVFVTNNGAFSKLARSFSIDHDLIQERHCPPVIQHSALAVAAWLRTGFGAISDIPMAHLLAYCERVLNVKKEVVEKAREVLRQYTPDQEAQYDLLLQDGRSVTKLMDFTLGDEGRLTEATVPVLLDEMRRATAAELTEEHERTLADYRRKQARERREAATSQATLSQEVGQLKAAIAATEADRVATSQRQRALVLETVSGNNSFMVKIRQATTTIAAVIAVVLVGNVILEWVDWQRDYPIIYYIGTVLTFYALLQQFIMWPSFGLGTALDWLGKSRFQRSLEKRGLVGEAELIELEWKYGQAKAIAANELG